MRYRCCEEFNIDLISLSKISYSCFRNVYKVCNIKHILHSFIFSETRIQPIITTDCPTENISQAVPETVHWPLVKILVKICKWNVEQTWRYVFKQNDRHRSQPPNLPPRPGMPPQGPYTSNKRLQQTQAQVDEVRARPESCSAKPNILSIAVQFVTTSWSQVVDIMRTNVEVRAINP